MTDKIAQEGLWGQYNIPTEEFFRIHFGPLYIWGRFQADEIWLAHKQYGSGQLPLDDHTEPPETLSWLRYTLQNGNHELRFTPLFPDKPLVIKTESPFLLLKGAEVKIYVRIPVWVRIQLSGTRIIELNELPSVTLSKTWFGQFTEGELCYWISSGARRQIEPDPERPFLAICPIHVVNSAEEDLSVEKLCLRVSGLSMFYDGKQLWSDEMKVYFKGSNDFSQLDIQGNPPVEAPEAILISEPRTPLKKGITHKTFATLKELPGLGIFIN